MSRNEPTPARLQRTGLLTLIGIALFAFVLTQVPKLFAPSYTDYVLRVELVEGADGVAVGNPVLVAGIPHGVITGVTPVDDGSDRPDAIEVDFIVDSKIPVSPNARVTRVTGLGNDGTALSIESLGTPGRGFPTAERRILRLAATTTRTSLVRILGVRNATVIENIDTNLESASEGISNRATEFRRKFDSLKVAIEELMRELEPERLLIQRDVRELGVRLERIRQAWSELAPELGAVQDEFAASRQMIEDRLEDWRRGWSRIQNNVGEVRENADGIMDEIGRIQSRMRDIGKNLDAAIADGRHVVTAMEEILPETKEAMQRTLARMVLAGGQLRMATQNLIPVAIEAIMISPDGESEGRRMLLEAVGDAVLASLDLEDAMRRTRMLARTAQTTDGLDVPVADMVEPLGRVVGELDRLLDAIYQRLRMEIAEDLPNR